VTEQESREQFEQWYQYAGISHWTIRFHREDCGKYTFVGTENAWRAWQASREILVQGSGK
jgi:lysylphosphatidylglycerol synthetase-like protein (DUF2156 family)